MVKLLIIANNPKHILASHYSKAEKSMIDFSYKKR